MDLKEDNIIGIVGGMGPQAGIDLMDHIVRLTQADKDQHHRSVILMSFPKHLVDRTSFVEGREDTNPGFNIAKIICRLESAGAKAIGIACNSSYIPVIYDVVLDELKQQGSKVKLIHMPQETCKHIRSFYPSVKRVGLLVTNGTYQSGIYQSYLQEMLFEPVVPEIEFQNKVINKMIYDPGIGIKARPDGITEEAKILFHKALDYFESLDTDVIILGCTELSLIMKDNYTRKMAIINSNEILARALLKETEKKQT